MPPLSEEQKTIRKSQATQVLAMMTFENVSQAEACDRVGISPKVYRTWIEEDDESVSIIRNLVNAVQAQELAMISVVQTEILQKLIEKALSGGMEDKDLIAALKLLHDRSDKLQSVVGVDKPEDNALEYLDGPNTREVRSRSGDRAGAKVNIKAKNDGSVDVELPVPEGVIIDSEFSED